MYGLILENIASTIKNKYGTKAWKEIQYVSGIEEDSFTQDAIYSEGYVHRIFWAAQDVTGDSLEEITETIGHDFYDFIKNYEYDKILRILGRTFTKFLNGLDNLHEYLKFTYPKLKPPSFFCEHASRTGLTLHYRSKRRGFLHYVKGQIKAIGHTLYDVEVKIELLDHEVEDNMEHIIMRLHFNNMDYMGNKGGRYDPLTQSEDCLYLNILSPRLRANDSTVFPVFFWLHGGGFETGSARQTGVDGTLRNLVSKGIVVVAAQYRLGAFGFWNTRSKGAPGNMAFHDQVAALKWTQENIWNFGGDAEEVTLGGNAAGAGSVSLLSLSPLAKGILDLFKQGILMSGSAFVPWAVRSDGDEANPSKDLEDQLGCTNSVDELVLDCMRSKSATEIMEAAQVRITEPGTGWAARIDGDILPQSLDALIPRSPEMNFLIGTTNHEWAYVDMAVKGSAESSKPSVERAVEKLANPHLFHNPSLVQRAAKFFYSDIHELQPSNTTAEKQFWFNVENTMKSALRFWAPAVKGATAHVKSGGTVFLYSWDYISPTMFNKEPWKGAVHTADLTYLFGKRYEPRENPALNMISPDPWTQEDTKMEALLVTLWTNFIKFRHPTPKPANGIYWTAYDPQKDNYLSIDRASKMKQGYHEPDVKFWNKLVPDLDGHGFLCSTTVGPCTRSLQLSLIVIVGFVTYIVQ